MNPFDDASFLVVGVMVFGLAMVFMAGLFDIGYCKITGRHIGPMMRTMNWLQGYRYDAWGRYYDHIYNPSPEMVAWEKRQYERRSQNMAAYHKAQQEGRRHVVLKWPPDPRPPQ